MNNENESEKMARAVLDAERYHRKALCLNRVGKSRLDCICESLYAAGYGDKKQAVKEFAEKKVKPLIDELVELMFNDYESHCKVENCEKPDDIPCGCSICVEENKQLWESKIDDFITELYGDDKNEN